MTPKRIILVRHGQSEANINKKAYETIPDYSFKLTEKGKEQAKEAGKAIKSVVGEQSIQAYVSPFTRTKQTFEGIAETIGNQVLKIYQEPRVREQSLGHFQSLETFMKNIDDHHEYGRFFYQIPDGESSADVHNRICSFIETLHRDFAQDSMAENCLVITHGITLRVLVMALTRGSVDYFESLMNPKNCEFVVLEYTQDGTFVLTEPMLTRASDYRGY